VNALPFGRQSHIRHSLELCRQLLANPGNILIVFPEGTRTATGCMGDFKPGIGTLVAGTGLPVVPCHLTGGFAAWPKGNLLPTPCKLHLRIGTPRTYAGLSADKDGAKAVCADLQAAVAKLGDQEGRQDQS